MHLLRGHPLRRNALLLETRTSFDIPLENLDPSRASHCQRRLFKGASRLFTCPQRVLEDLPLSEHRALLRH